MAVELKDGQEPRSIIAPTSTGTPKRSGVGASEGVLVSLIACCGMTPGNPSPTATGVSLNLGGRLVEVHTAATGGLSGGAQTPGGRGHAVGGRGQAVPSTDDVIAFGGIPDLATDDKRASLTIQAQSNADDSEMGRAMRATKLHNIENITGMEVNTSYSILHFLEAEIIDNVGLVGVSLGNNAK
ncbi:hypothetical protein D1007_54612 [Hordeum vulgare]|nr:hypothetical protein D1007_54612 [Hordeum vulgare]